MEVSYIPKDSKNKNEIPIPKNISIRTMQSDLIRLKELAKQKPGKEFSEEETLPPEKIIRVDLKAEETGFLSGQKIEKEKEKKEEEREEKIPPAEIYKKAAPPSGLPMGEEIKREIEEEVDKKEEAETPEVIEEKKIKAEIYPEKIIPEKEAILLKGKIKEKSGRKSRKKLLIIILLLILFSASLFFYYWFFYNKIEEPAPVPAEKTEEKEEKLKSIIPKIPFVEKFKNLTIPETQYPLVPIEEVFVFDLVSEEGFNFLAVLENYLEKQENIPEVALIEIKKEDKILDLNSLAKNIGIEIPENIKSDLENNYNLIFLNIEENYRLGFIVKVNNLDNIKKNIKEWEETMTDDLNLLFFETEVGEPATSDFQENIYQGVEIRYLNFPESDTTIDYAFLSNKLIVATSKNGIYKIIDILKD